MTLEGARKSAREEAHEAGSLPPFSGQPAGAFERQRLQAPGGDRAGEARARKGVVVQHLAIAQSHLLEIPIAEPPQATAHGRELGFEGLPDGPPQADETRVVHQASSTCNA